MPVFYSPSNNPEVWDECPPGYGDAPFPPPLEEARHAKLNEINAAFLDAESHGHLTSALGFDIDANERANRDIAGLIIRMQALGETSTLFCDYANTMREVTLDDLHVMQLEVIAYGQALYARKWQLREQALAAQTVEDVVAVRWSAP